MVSQTFRFPLHNVCQPLALTLQKPQLHYSLSIIHPERQAPKRRLLLLMLTLSLPWPHQSPLWNSLQLLIHFYYLPRRLYPLQVLDLVVVVWLAHVPHRAILASALLPCSPRVRVSLRIHWQPCFHGRWQPLRLGMETQFGSRGSRRTSGLKLCNFPT